MCTHIGHARTLWATGADDAGTDDATANGNTAHATPEEGAPGGA